MKYRIGYRHIPTNTIGEVDWQQVLDYEFHNAHPIGRGEVLELINRWNRQSHTLGPKESQGAWVYWLEES